MSALDDVNDIFATLHDGEICECAGTYQELEIKVECSYLAKYIEPYFKYFYVRLYLVEEFCFEEYTLPLGSPNRAIYDFNELANAGIELLYSSILSDRVKVDCTKGELYIKCASIEIFDQQKRSFPSAELFKISDLYWSRE